MDAGLYEVTVHRSEKRLWVNPMHIVALQHKRRNEYMTLVVTGSGEHGGATSFPITMESGELLKSEMGVIDLTADG
ncbi:hypothetical protein K8I28_08685 [bacterium]|nr:hypothetical protein [bacterium]